MLQRDQLVEDSLKEHLIGPKTFSEVGLTASMVHQL